MLLPNSKNPFFFPLLFMQGARKDRTFSVWSVVSKFRARKLQILFLWPRLTFEYQSTLPALNDILLVVYKEEKYAITKTMLFYLRRHVAEFLGLHDAVFFNNTKMMFQHCSSTKSTAFFLFSRSGTDLKLQCIRYHLLFF
uniref:Uncharacterized protein n=1 Tax=Setaria viridis TaxID=4556 RepID=A0A4U6WQI7_SETVI|nr:hypothetical protein SEVIR_1G295500v2 [Setaria viridis]